MKAADIVVGQDYAIGRSPRYRRRATVLAVEKREMRSSDVWSRATLSRTVAVVKRQDGGRDTRLVELSEVFCPWAEEQVRVDARGRAKAYEDQRVERLEVAVDRVLGALGKNRGRVSARTGYLAIRLTEDEADEFAYALRKKWPADGASR